MTKARSGGGGGRCLVVLPQGSSAPELEAAFTPLGLEAARASTKAEALACLERERFAAAFVSQALGPVAISSIIARPAPEQPELPVVILGCTGTVQEAVDAMQQGAADYLVPPFEAKTVSTRLRRLLARAAKPEPERPPASSPTGLIGSSAPIRRLLSTLEKISRYKTNVLILGESGTGKELIARALHARGPRRHHLFVPLNCATLGRDLLENELFGHEKGAFTGANERKKGLFELADGGTLFLDEIGEMEPSTQAKLLRVLERNEFRRVGGTDKVRVDASVIAATNRNIEEAIRAGKFREDLYYRLKVVTLVIPPLRERKEDIPALIETFIADFNRRNDGRIEGVSPQAMKLLMEYDWPGNVRELKNAVESAAILASGETIDPSGFAELLSQPAPSAPPTAATRPNAVSGERAITVSVGATLAETEKALILATLHNCQTKRQAARLLGIGLRTLYTKLRAYDLEPGAPQYRAETARRAPQRPTPRA